MDIELLNVTVIFCGIIF